MQRYFKGVDMRIAIIGAGQVGRALATNWSQSDIDITLGVIDPENTDLQNFARTINVSVAISSIAATEADVIVLSLPWVVAEEAVKGLGDVSGKTIIDCMNPLTMKDGELALQCEFNTSAAEAVASWLPKANVVKSFNQVGAEIMADPSALAGRPLMFLAGDDEPSKATVSSLVKKLGFEALDAGKLSQARILEPFGMVWINQALNRGKGRNWAFGVLEER
jgi:predicted dinucleotide-binding enzyme